MIGAIAGDIIGSVHEFSNIKTEDFPLFHPQSTFTDDTVMTIAVTDSILTGKGYAVALKEWGRLFPYAGYGGMFKDWLRSDGSGPYNSFGNGSAMRVSAVGFAFDNLDEVLAEAKKSAEVTHNHPEGIKGAQSTAAAIFLARTGKTKKEIKEYIETTFNYDLSRTLAEIRPGYSFNETCQGSVPQAVTAFLESGSYEDAVRKAISLGGDTDTQGSIAGGIAQAYYKTIGDDIIKKVRKILDARLLAVVDAFSAKYGGL
jgi:ADP-ribosylglycohydrolase